VTPADEIVAFTPSSASHRRVKLAGASKTTIEGIASSPSPATPRGTFTAQAFAVDEDSLLPSFQDIMKENEERDRLEHIRSAKQAALNQKKALALQARQSVAPSADSDDDFEIFNDQPKRGPRPPVLAFVQHRGPDARAVLNMTSNKPAVTKSRQGMVNMMGKTARPKGDVTETLAQRAGKAFGSNQGPAIKRVGQKKGDPTITQRGLDAMIVASHSEQVALLRKKKELEFGRGRRLPARQTRDFSELATKAEQLGVEVQEDEDEDEEDEDYRPEGEKAEVADEEVEIVYSGEESGDDEPVAGSASPEVVDLPDKENQPPAESDEEGSPIGSRRPRASAIATVDGDNEDAVTPRSSARPMIPLRDRQPSSDQQSAVEIDLAGFGASSSPGFSQLFGETQAFGSTAQVGLVVVVSSLQ
jgi:mediator of replication checkpoint protein 1